MKKDLMYAAAAFTIIATLEAPIGHASILADVWDPIGHATRADSIIKNAMSQVGSLAVGINAEPQTQSSQPDQDAPNSRLVPQQDRDALVQAVSEYDRATSRVAYIYEDILFGVTLGSIAIGLGASIAAFCKKSTLAGILSIIAAGILGTGSALPIAQDADFYHLLAAQSQALRIDAELHPRMTVSDYVGLRDGLKTLALFSGEKFPSRTGTQEATQALISQLHAVRVAIPSIN